MHDAALQWVAAAAASLPFDHPPSVLDIGGRDVNGTCRDLFPDSVAYAVLDVRPGENVNIVADAATWKPTNVFDVVLCTEVFEHTPSWRDIIRTAYAALVPGGAFIATAASPGRPAHSGIDPVGAPYPGEHYAGISRFELDQALAAAGFVDIVVDEQLYPADVRCVARREG